MVMLEAGVDNCVVYVPSIINVSTKCLLLRLSEVRWHVNVYIAPYPVGSGWVDLHARYNTMPEWCRQVVCYIKYGPLKWCGVLNSGSNNGGVLA